MKKSNRKSVSARRPNVSIRPLRLKTFARRANLVAERTERELEKLEQVVKSPEVKGPVKSKLRSRMKAAVARLAALEKLIKVMA